MRRILGRIRAVSFDVVVEVVLGVGGWIYIIHAYVDGKGLGSVLPTYAGF